MTASEAAHRKSEELGCPCRPDTVTREVLDRLESPDVQMALAELDRKNGVVAEPEVDAADIFVEPRRKRRRATAGGPASGEKNERVAGSPAPSGDEAASGRRRRKRRPGDGGGASSAASSEQQAAPAAGTHRRRHHQAAEGGAAGEGAQQAGEVRLLVPGGHQEGHRRGLGPRVGGPQARHHGEVQGERGGACEVDRGDAGEQRAAQAHHDSTIPVVVRPAPVPTSSTWSPPVTRPCSSAWWRVSGMLAATTLPRCSRVVSIFSSGHP